MGVAAGPDRDFAVEWAENFEREYGVRPRLLYKGKTTFRLTFHLWIFGVTCIVTPFLAPANGDRIHG